MAEFKQASRLHVSGMKRMAQILILHGASVHLHVIINYLNNYQRSAVEGTRMDGHF